MAGAASASPWNRAPGHLFVLSRADYFRAEGGPVVGPEGETTRFERFETSDYTELGLTGAFMIGGKVGYALSSFSNGFIESSANGYTEAEGFIQHQIFHRERHALAVKLTAGAPQRFDAGRREGLVSDGADIELRVLYGRSVPRPFNAFAAAEIGYRRRFGDAADEVRGDLLVGAQPASNLLLLGEIFATRSVRNEAPGGADYDVVKLQASAVYRFSHRHSLQAGYRREVAGRNLLLGDAYFLGLWSVF